MGLDELATTDNSERVIELPEGLIIEQYFLPKGEYLEGPTNKEYLFLHHTAGWHNHIKRSIIGVETLGDVWQQNLF